MSFLTATIKQWESRKLRTARISVAGTATSCPVWAQPLASEYRQATGQGFRGLFNRYFRGLFNR